MFILSLINFNNKNTLEHLSNSNFICQHKNELFELIGNIEKNCIKTCMLCNIIFDTKFLLKKHILQYCFFYNYIRLNNNNGISDNILINFDDLWDISHINEDRKIFILFSNELYIVLLKEILKNNKNLNFKIDNEKNEAFIYINNNYIKISISVLITNIMSKLFMIYNNIIENNKVSVEYFINIVKNILHDNFKSFLENPIVNNKYSNEIINLYGKI